MTLLFWVWLALVASILWWSVSALKRAQAKRLELELLVHRAERERDELMQRIKAMRARDESRPGQQELLDAASVKGSIGRRRQEGRQGANAPPVVPLVADDPTELPPPSYYSNDSSKS